jgi:hypothetical protein
MLGQVRDNIAVLMVMALAGGLLQGQTSATCPEGPPSSFLSRHGTQLSLEGEPFTQVGFNKPDLLAYFRSGRNSDVLQVRQLLGELRRRGFRVLRVELFPPGPGELEEQFLSDPARHQAYLDGIDGMLQECEDHGMLLVCSLMSLDAWADLGHHSLSEAVQNPQSPGRQKGEQFIRELVTRYQRRSIIAAWEIGPQYNLAVDLQALPGPLEAREAGANWQHLHPAPIVRDSRNNITSDQLAQFVAQLAGLIRSIDPNHLISAGHAAPRREAMHLLEACRHGQAPQWHDDTLAQQTRYLELIHPDPVDWVSISHFEMTPTRLALLKSAADELGKPLLISRIGLPEPWIKPARYDEPAAVELVRCQGPVLRELKIPLTLYWRLADYSGESQGLGVAEHSLKLGATEKALDLLRQCNQGGPPLGVQP